MTKNIARVVSMLVLSSIAYSGGVAAQGQMSRIFSGPDEVPGVEFNAALNDAAINVKVGGTIFVPDSARRLRAVIVLIERGPRSELAAQGRFGDQDWRRLSQTCACGLLYFRLDTIRPMDANTPVAGDPLRNAAVGGADALLLLLQRLGDESAHREMKDAPLLFWGWSNAASFGTTFAEQYPDRTAAFIRYHTHLRGLPVNMKVLKNIPALLIAGGKDETAGTDDAASLFRGGRSGGAPWTFAIEPDATHGSSEDTFFRSGKELIIPWIEAVLRQRVAPDSTKLRPIANDTEWLGDNETGEVAPRIAFSGSRTGASWLPDELTAHGWRTVLRASK
jgi:hypothetical protein